ncbi:hypothetical protein CERZMDRAFT_84624 [Cercospora zeae-maydis SCOH1-5]|uniref:WD40 repeat-like protein n=1 Tax=Cercospora zeae-maydis SCOH1-5 TaxID=717836 RepID=A0A6A6FFN7_9PEZI|nr:hypothetical protein CERZMDRAFT_84624 [Cercospora zeae-maydis SCOH1-5]
MSNSRSVDKNSILTRPSGDNAKFSLPRSSHLIIATPRHIFAWDTFGIHKIFQSSRDGIVAAREAKDGSGLLAVASKDVVVLHDTKRGKEHSWGLNAPDQELRHLEYSRDAKMLYLSTTSDGLIQQYSVEKSRLLEPLQKHESAPVALAVSCSGDLMLSASSDPPAIYLKNMTQDTRSILVQPSASTAPVCAAAFHPERPNIFMLGFRDATVAAFDATKLANIAGTYSTQPTAGWEIASLQNLHRKVVAEDFVSETTSIVSAIAGVAFLPGSRLRAVTAGRDGRCRLIDFANGGIVLRTWHCKEACTSLAILSGDAGCSVRTVPARNGRLNEEQDRRGEVIAVGLADGAVQLYNNLGLLLAQQRVSSREEKIFSVEWSVGPSPVAIKNAPPVNFEDSDIEVSLRAVPKLASSPVEGMASRDVVSRQPATRGSGRPKGLQEGQALPTQQIQRQLTFHPDELGDSTVRRTLTSKQSRSTPFSGHPCQDLFTPAEKKSVRVVASGRQLSSPPRHRPRISSQTFVRYPGSSIRSTRSTRGKLALSKRALANRTSSASSEVRREQAAPKTSLGDRRRERPERSPFDSRGRHVNFKPSEAFPGDAACASFRSKASRRTRASIQSKVSKEQSRGRSISRAQGSLRKKSEREEEIWLTSESEEGAPVCEKPLKNKARIHRYQAFLGQSPQQDGPSLQGPLGPQAYISPGSGLTGVSSDVRELFPRTSSLSPRIARRPKHVKENRTTPPQLAANGDQNDGTVDTAAPSIPYLPTAATARVLRTPWTRVRADKDAARKQQQQQNLEGQPPAPNRKMRSIRKNAFVTVLQQQDGSKDRPLESSPEPPEGLTRSPSWNCLSCAETQARVEAVEGEMERLKGEVSKLKSVLLRQGTGLDERKRSWRWKREAD